MEIALIKIRDYDLGWLVALIDSEGYLGLKKNNYGYNPCLAVKMYSKEMIKRAREITGFGGLGKEENQNQTYYYWIVSANGLRKLLPLIQDKLIEKKEQCKLILEALALTTPNGRYKGDELERKKEIALRIQELNSGGNK